MKTIQKLMALSAVAALPLGVATAAQPPTTASHEIKAEDNETKTINLKITGMT